MEEKRPKKRRTGWIIFGLLCLAVAGCVAGYLLAMKTLAPDYEAQETDNQEGIIQEEEVHTGEIIKEEILNLGQLVTAEYHFTEVESYDSSKEISGVKLPFTNSKYIFSYDGVLKAGIDFQGIVVEENWDGSVITLRLPKAQILSAEINPDSFKVYDEKESIFNKTGITEMNDSINNLLTNAQQRAIDGGLLKRAEDNAKTLISNFVKSFLPRDDIRIMVVIQN